MNCCMKKDWRCYSMLIDLHAHSSGISRCCRADGQEVVRIAKEVGIEGLVLTNHYQKSYIINNDVTGFARRYIDEYDYVKSEGEKIGLNVYFGIEVTLSKHRDIHVLIYGVDTSFVEEYSDIFDYTQEDLYRLVKKHNGILVQAHPYRKNIDNLLDVNYLDGVEVNCHPLYEGTHIEKIFEIAKNNNLIVTCGGDYHADTHRAKCGVYLPNEIKNVYDIKNYLLNTEKIDLCIQEVDSFKAYNISYCCIEK